jgi:hypothetical protein
MAETSAVACLHLMMFAFEKKDLSECFIILFSERSFFSNANISSCVFAFERKDLSENSIMKHSERNKLVTKAATMMKAKKRGHVT